jgi:hypothetical protein
MIGAFSFGSGKLLAWLATAAAGMFTAPLTWPPLLSSAERTSRITAGMSLSM